MKKETLKKVEETLIFWKLFAKRAHAIKPNEGLFAKWPISHKFWGHFCPSTRVKKIYYLRLTSCKYSVENIPVPVQKQPKLPYLATFLATLANFVLYVCIYGRLLARPILQKKNLIINSVCVCLKFVTVRRAEHFFSLIGQYSK